MLSLKSFVVALSLLSSVGADGLYPVKKFHNNNRRNNEPAQPSCADFTAFKYAGCFVDDGKPRTLLYTGPRNKNQTVQDCVAFCKGNNYRYAGLEYGEECFCGASVNNVQADEADCNFGCTGDSTEICGGFNRVTIYQDPTFPNATDGISDYELLGCYSEGSNGRSLAWTQDQVNATTMTVESCLTACKSGGYSFAGVEYAQECYCGVVLGNGTAPVDSSRCDMKCNGDSSETCGGRGVLDLYVAKDLESSEPCTSRVSSSSSAAASPTTSASSSSSTDALATTSTDSSIPTSTDSSIPTSSPPTSSSSSSSSSSSTSTTSSVAPLVTPTSSSSSSSSSASSSPPVVPTTSSSSSSVSTTKPPTSSSTSITPTTSKPPSLCTSTTTVSPSPTCEYKCGSWCSSSIPKFSDKNSCWTAFSACTQQVASCFLQAGFPDSMNCFQFSNWCNSISTYCGNYCPGNNCSKEGCKSKYPPNGNPPPAPSVSTSVYPCTSTPSTTTSSSTSVVPVPAPTNTNICTQPHNPSKGYSSNAPVGNIGMPCLTCNNAYNGWFSGYPFKLYTSTSSNDCPQYPRSGPKGPQQGCKDACDTQYQTCMNTYAQGCKNSQRGDNYQSATTKCKSQWSDCYSANTNPNTSGRCGSWNSGWGN